MTSKSRPTAVFPDSFITLAKRRLEHIIGWADERVAGWTPERDFWHLVQKDHRLQSSLLAACAKDAWQDGVVRCLDAGADPTWEDGLGPCAGLRGAARVGALDIVRLLREAGADPEQCLPSQYEDEETQRQSDPWWCAASRGHVAILADFVAFPCGRRLATPSPGVIGAENTWNALTEKLLTAPQTKPPVSAVAHERLTALIAVHRHLHEAPAMGGLSDLAVSHSTREWLHQSVLTALNTGLVETDRALMALGALS